MGELEQGRSAKVDEELLVSQSGGDGRGVSWDQQARLSGLRSSPLSWIAPMIPINDIVGKHEVVVVHGMICHIGNSPERILRIYNKISLSCSMQRRFGYNRKKSTLLGLTVGEG